MYHSQLPIIHESWEKKRFYVVYYEDRKQGKAYHLQEYIQEHHNNISPLRKLLIVQNEV